ncbi:MAG: translesion DNA synthesis-associated protein ImuA [Burkholderiales bacterium]
MNAPSAAALLAARLAHPAVWRGGDCAPEPSSVPTGFPALDAVLPGGGWPGAGLAEILLAREGIGEIALMLPSLVALQRARREIVWIAPPHRPYAPALAAAGVDLTRFHIVRCARPDDALWACEQALRAPECGAAYAWLAARDERVLRRLQVAARDGRTLGVLWRRPGERAISPAAPLRLGLAPHAGARSRLAVHVLKRRGGEVGRPVVLDLDARCLVAPELASRPPRTLAPPRLPGPRPDPRSDAGHDASRATRAWRTLRAAS